MVSTTFSLSPSNSAGIKSPNDAGEGFEVLVSFINKSYLGHAITEAPLLDRERLKKFWKSAVVQDNNGGSQILFKMDNKDYTLTVKGINEALGIVLSKGESFRRLVDDETLKKFFCKIGYSGPILVEGGTKWYPTGEMDRKYLRKEWSMIFDVMIRVFTNKTSGWNGISSTVKKLTHSLVHGYKVNIGKIVMEQLTAALGKKSTRKGVCIYPRFLMLCINSLCGVVEDAPLFEECNVLHKMTHTMLTSRNSNAHIYLFQNYLFVVWG